MDKSTTTENETKMEKSKYPNTAVIYREDADLEENSFNATSSNVDDNHMLEDINQSGDVTKHRNIHDKGIITVEDQSNIDFSEDNIRGSSADPELVNCFNTVLVVYLKS